MRLSVISQSPACIWPIGAVGAERDQPARLEHAKIARDVRLAQPGAGYERARGFLRRPPALRLTVQEQQQLRRVHCGHGRAQKAKKLIRKSGVFHLPASSLK